MFGALLLGVSAASAQPTPTSSEADRLFEEGRELAKAGQYAEACDRFTRSFELEHTVGTELNLGDCHEKLGHLRQAWQLFNDAADESGRTADTKRTKFAHDRADALAAKLTTVILKVAQPAAVGLTITIAGRTEQPAAEVRDRVDPGSIEVVASVPDHPRFTRSVDGIAGATVVIVVPAFADAAKPIEHVVEQRRRSRVRLAWGLAGVGSASAIAASVLTLIGRSHYNTTADSSDCMHVPGGIVCNDAGDKKIADAQKLADFGTGFAIGCGAFVAASAIVYFTAPTDSVIVPTVTTQSVGVAISRRF